MNDRCFQFAVLLAGSALLLSAQPPSFNDKLYPILEKAGCRNCHNVEGVASATRLHFPLPKTPTGTRSTRLASRWSNSSTGRIPRIRSCC